MERGLEIFFSSSVLKEEDSLPPPPSLRRYADERERTRWKPYKGKQVPHKPELLSCSWLFGFSPSHFFFFLPPPSPSSSLPWARSMEMRVRCVSPAPPSAQCPYARVACVRVCMHEHNVDHRMVGCISNVRCGKYLGARDSPIFVTRCAREDRASAVNLR